MQYISQLNAFWNWVDLNEVSHLEVDLYLTLLRFANATGWKPCFTIPNTRLWRFNKNELTKARNRLVQLGLIEYEKGKKGQAPAYRIVPLYEIIPQIDTNTDTNIDTDCVIVPQIDTNIDTNSDTNIDTDSDTNLGNINRQRIRLRNNINISPYIAPLKSEKKPGKPKKKKYAEFVTMTEEEFDILAEKYGKSAVEKMITKLDNYKGTSGKTYKSDYRAILAWTAEAVLKEMPKENQFLQSDVTADEFEKIMWEKMQRENENAEEKNS